MSVEGFYFVEQNKYVDRIVCELYTQMNKT